MGYAELCHTNDYKKNLLLLFIVILRLASFI